MYDAKSTYPKQIQQNRFCNSTGPLQTIYFFFLKDLLNYIIFIQGFLSNSFKKLKKKEYHYQMWTVLVW